MTLHLDSRGPLGFGEEETEANGWRCRLERVEILEKIAHLAARAADHPRSGFGTEMSVLFFSPEEEGREMRFLLQRLELFDSR